MTTIKDDTQNNQKEILEEKTPDMKKDDLTGDEGQESVQEEAKENKKELTVEEQLAQALEESAKNLDGWKRSMADYQNLKKESDERYKELVKYANAGLLEDLATVLENFQVALDSVPQDIASNAWVQGVGYIHKQMQEVLLEKGVEFIEPKIGDEFDPNLHEAIENNDKKDNAQELSHKIVKVLRKGLMLNGRLIRSARVNVG